VFFRAIETKPTLVGTAACLHRAGPINLSGCATCRAIEGASLLKDTIVIANTCRRKQSRSGAPRLRYTNDRVRIIEGFRRGGSNPGIVDPSAIRKIPAQLSD
jgi:hypothetical protein